MFWEIPMEAQKWSEKNNDSYLRSREWNSTRYWRLAQWLASSLPVFYVDHSSEIETIYLIFCFLINSIYYFHHISIIFLSSKNLPVLTIYDSEDPGTSWLLRRSSHSSQPHPHGNRDPLVMTVTVCYWKKGQKRPIEIELSWLTELKNHDVFFQFVM